MYDEQNNSGFSNAEKEVILKLLEDIHEKIDALYYGIVFAITGGAIWFLWGKFFG